MLNSVVMTILLVGKNGRKNLNRTTKKKLKCPVPTLQKYMGRANSNKVLFTFLLEELTAF